MFFMRDFLSLLPCGILDLKEGIPMIETEIRKTPTGLQTKIFRNDCCELKFFDISSISASGQIRHTKEKVYSPVATVTCNDKHNWEISLTMPRTSVSLDTWPRLKAATEDILEFWTEVQEKL